MTEPDNNYETPEQVREQIVIPSSVHSPDAGRLNAPEKKTGFWAGFRQVGVWVPVAAVPAVILVSWIWNRPADVNRNDPSGNLQDENGCELVGRTDQPDETKCIILNDLDLGGAASVPPRTFIEPLPEGVSGRVASNALSATPTDLGGPELSRSLPSLT